MTVDSAGKDLPGLLPGFSEGPKLAQPFSGLTPSQIMFQGGAKGGKCLHWGQRTLSTHLPRDLCHMLKTRC